MASRTLVGRLAFYEHMQQLSWAEFEQACAALFRGLGYEASLTSEIGDAGVDIVLRREGQRDIVQCKHWKERAVGSPAVRELLGAKQDFGAADAYLVTSGFFSESARALARRNKGLHLWDRDTLMAAAGRMLRDQAQRDHGSQG